MFIQNIEFGTPAFDEALSLRNDILRIPLGLVFDPKDIQTEWDSIHLGAYEEDNMLRACLTLLPINKTEIKMRQVAVMEATQRQGVGSALVQASEEVCQNRKFKKLVLHAREAAVPFYKRLGYKTQGKMFEEVGIPHYKMYKNL